MRRMYPMKRTLTALLMLTPMLASAAEHRVELRETHVWQPGAPLSFENLVGEISIASHGGGEVVIEVEVVASARGDDDAVALARSVTLERDGQQFWMEFPTHEHNRFIHRVRGWTVNTSTSYRGRRVSVASRGRGVEVHANVRITVPHGTELTVRHSVGSTVAEGAQANLILLSGSGKVETMQTEGGLHVNSGSGPVTITGHAGNIEARTGSGSIRVEEVTSDSVSLRTGSGSVRLETLSHAEDLMVSTGSGSIRADADLSTIQRMRLTTGSGSINITSRANMNTQIEARSGSGSVSVEAPGLHVTSSERNVYEGVIGEGVGEVRMITGSGSIRFRVSP